MSQAKPVRVAVVSDQPIFRRGLTALLMTLKQIQLVGEGRDGEDALQLADMVHPDLLLLDLKFPVEKSRSITSELHTRFPDIRVILLVSYLDEGQIQCDPDRGIEYCFSKDISEDELISALHRIAEDVHVPVDDVPPVPIHVVDQPFKTDLFVGNGEPVDYAQIQARLEQGEILSREMIMAGKIQADILPDRTPRIRGWDIAARLISARETSGDFYDFIPLLHDNWGIVVADVTDKGMGAALFMALSSTLLRTYAVRYPTLPALAMDVVNERILSDTRGSMFVTALYAVLEPHIGRLRFVNAGHPPGILASKQKGKPVDRLRPTGMALGVKEDIHWQQKIVRFNPGDVLVLYTDGITEAQSRANTYFGEQRLVDIVRQKMNCTADMILESILDEVNNFSADAHQDDIALIVLKMNDAS